MTTHEAFKKRIRARMAKTGERYNAARRALLARSEQPKEGSGWAAQPLVVDERIRQHTGRGWDEWVELIDAGPGRDAGHSAIAAWVQEAHQVDGWWAQSVTVGYERITGLRLPGQMPDGTFTVSRSRVLGLDPEEFRVVLLDEAERATLLPGLTSTPRSRPTAKSLRFQLADADSGEAAGTVMFTADRAGERIRLTVTHEKLLSAEAGEAWKEYWADWLAALADG